jgi:hypothetical protein
MKFLKVKDHKDLLRDPNSKAIVNHDNEALNKYKEERALRLKLSGIANDYDQLKSEVSEIKDMLKLILERTNK